MDFVLFSYLLKLLAWSNPITGKLSFFIIFGYMFYLILKKNKFDYYLFGKYKTVFFFLLLNMLMFLIMVYISIVINMTLKFYTISIYLYVYFFVLLSFISLLFDRRKVISIISNIIYFFLFAIIFSIILDILFLYDFYIAHYKLGIINFLKNRTDTIYYYRGCGFFSDPTAHVTILFLLPLISFIGYKFHFIKKTLFLIANIIGIFSVFLSTSKIGIPLYLMEIFLLYITQSISFNSIVLKFIKFSILIFIIIIIVTFIVIWLDKVYDTPILSSIENFGTSSGTVQERLLTYRTALKIIDNNMLFGIGFNEISKYLPLTIHNTFLQIWAENGIVGLIYAINIFIILPLLVFIKLKISYCRYSFIIFYIVFFIKINVVDALHTFVPFIYFYAIFFVIYIDYYLRFKGYNKNDVDRF